MKNAIRLLVSAMLFLTLVLSPIASVQASAGLMGGIPIQGTPFDKKMLRTGIFDLHPDTWPAARSSSADDLFAIARTFRYTKDRGPDRWQTPMETDQKRSGDCEDKALWLYAQLKQNGHDNVRLVIGKYKSTDRNYHVWVQYDDATGSTRLLDPAAQRRPWTVGEFSTGFYKPLYSYDGNNRFKHF